MNPLHILDDRKNIEDTIILILGTPKEKRKPGIYYLSESKAGYDEISVNSNKDMEYKSGTGVIPQVARELRTRVNNYYQILIDAKYLDKNNPEHAEEIKIVNDQLDLLQRMSTPPEKQ